MDNEKKTCPMCHGEGEEGARMKMRTEEEKKALIHRLSRIEGQIRGVKKMVEEDRYCPDILTQSSAISAALGSFNKELLASHISSCVVEKIRTGSEEEVRDVVEELTKTLQKLMG